MYDNNLDKDTVLKFMYGGSMIKLKGSDYTNNNFTNAIYLKVGRWADNVKQIDRMRHRKLKQTSKTREQRRVDQRAYRARKNAWKEGL